MLFSGISDHLNQPLTTNFPRYSDRGLAEYLLVPQTEVISIGNADPIMYAPLTDAALTAYHAIDTVAHRLEIAKELGADESILFDDDDDDATGGGTKATQDILQ